MPKKRAVDPAVMKQKFDDWQGSKERELMKQIENSFDDSHRTYPKEDFGNEMDRNSNFRLQLGDEDIYQDYQPTLNLLHQLVCEMKVPHKAKVYEQKFVRSMHF
jgi:hypothetical protein